MFWRGRLVLWWRSGLLWRWLGWALSLWGAFRRLLGDGSQWGMSITYAEQPKPAGIAQALVIAEDFIAGQPSALILGDNIFYGRGLSAILQRVNQESKGATVFGYYVSDPERYGVAELDADGKVVDIEEKPVRPRSNYAVTGLYFYDRQVVDIASALTPSARGELEITDLNRCYLEEGSLHLEQLGRGYAWLDTGTPENMLAAGNFIHTIVVRQGLQIACPEELAFNNRWISAEQVLELAKPLSKTTYGQYLIQCVERR